MHDISSCRFEAFGGHTSTSYETVQTVSTNTGSAIGRAIVGGVVGGGVGAIIGASTAPKEIKPKTIAKNHYVSKFYCLIIEFKENRQFVSTVTTNSRNKMEEMVNFINSEINNFKSKCIEIEKKNDKTLVSFIESPLDFSFDQVKEFDTKVMTVSDYLLLSNDITLKCANNMKLKCLQHVTVGKEDVNFTSSSISFEECKKDAIRLKEYLMEKYGQPDKDLNIESITIDETNKGVHLRWGKKASFMFYYVPKSLKYLCSIAQLRKKEFKKEEVSVSIEYQQRLGDYQEFMKNPLSYPVQKIKDIDPKCHILKGDVFYLSKESIQMCSNIVELKALCYVSIGSKNISFSSKTNIFEDIRHDTMTLYHMVKQIIGEANQDLNDLTEESFKKEIRIRWDDFSFLSTRFDKEDQLYSVLLVLNKKEG